MKSIIISLLMTAASFNLYAAPAKKEEPTMELKAHIVKMMLSDKGVYNLELREYAAVYHAEEKHITCIQEAIKENKQATLKVSARSLFIQECSLK